MGLDEEEGNMGLEDEKGQVWMVEEAEKRSTAGVEGVEGGSKDRVCLAYLSGIIFFCWKLLLSDKTCIKFIGMVG